jgi:membrane protease subunit (stomatin/prohibitin family)
MVFGKGSTDVTTGDRGGSLIGATTIAWDDAFKRGNILWRVPRNIKWNDNIVVREDEIAVFYRDGKALAYIDRPDRYALTSQNAPLWGWLQRVFSGVQQQAEVYYLQKRVFDGKFGSKQPYQFKDKEFGIVNLRLFGEVRYKVGDPMNFINQFVGTFNSTTNAEVEERIRDQVVILVYDALGHLKDKGMGVTDLASNLTNMEQVVLEKSKPHFEPYGVSIEKVSGLYISLPEEVQKAVDARSSMGVLGVNYMQYQTGQAMRDAAQNPSGGAAGVGAGLGAGMGMGYVMVDQMRQGTQQQQPGVQGQGQPAQGKPCVKCGAIIPSEMMFCGKCGAKQEAGKPCVKCGEAVPPGMKFCGKCGSAQTIECAECKKEVPGDMKFCPYCGKPVAPG